jgi:hypothetical protein
VAHYVLFYVRYSRLWRGRLQGKGVQFTAHTSTKGLIDHLMLLHTAFAGKGG